MNADFFNSNTFIFITVLTYLGFGGLMLYIFHSIDKGKATSKGVLIPLFFSFILGVVLLNWAIISL